MNAGMVEICWVTGLAPLWVGGSAPIWHSNVAQQILTEDILRLMCPQLQYELPVWTSQFLALPRSAESHFCVGVMRSARKLVY